MQNQVFDLPIRISDVTSMGVISAQWKLNFNPNTLIPKAVITTGTIAQLWGTPTVNVSSSTIDVAMAGSFPLSGQGIIAYVRFQVKRSAVQNSNLDLQNILLNETPVSNIVNGIVFPIPGPVITLVTGVTAITRGDTVTYSATGGIPPYKWFSSDTLVAMVDSLKGKVKAKSRGTFTLTAVDAQGFDGIFTITVNDFFAALPDTSVRIGDSVDVPIMISNVTGLGIQSSKIKFAYDTSKVRFSLPVLTGTISSGMSVAVFDSGTFITLQYSGVAPISGSGIFSKLRFHHKAPSGPGQFSMLGFMEFENNGGGVGQPTATLKSGRLNIAVALNKIPLFTRMMNDTTISEDQLLTFDYKATDPDLDQVKFSLQNASSGMTIDSLSGLFTWKPTFCVLSGCFCVESSHQPVAIGISFHLSLNAINSGTFDKL